jgi:hypothetical protein
MFSKDIQLPIATDEANERNRSLRDVIQVGKLEFRGRENGDKVFLLDLLERGLALKAAIAVGLLRKSSKFFDWDRRYR